MQPEPIPTSDMDVLATCLEAYNHFEHLPWDDYYMRMAQADFLCGRHRKKASKTYFIRKAPFGGSYALFGGLTAFLLALKNLRFTPDTSETLRDLGYAKPFLDFLEGELRHLRLQVHAVHEGGLIFPHEPVVILEGDLVSVRIAEGIMLKELNFPTLSMTKWNRVVQAAAPGGVLEFARRRAQDSFRTSVYAHLAGCQVSSNAELRHGFKKIPVVGTMGHEWIQSFGDEAEAFDKWLEFNPDRPVLLVDTIDTLKSGLPNAIKAFQKHWGRIQAANGRPGIRNDSGDLALITIEERIALDKAGLHDVYIYETNDLDEYSIQNIKEQIFTASQRANLDPLKVLEKIIWAAGTMPGTCYDQPSLGGVAKLTSIENEDGDIRGVIKLAKDNPVKTSIPGSNRSAHVWADGRLICCVIHGSDEDPKEVRLARHPDDYSRTIDISNPGLEFKIRQTLVYDSIAEKHLMARSPSVDDIHQRVHEATQTLHWTVKRFTNPTPVPVHLSPQVFGLRSLMISKNQLIQPHTFNSGEKRP